MAPKILSPVEISLGDWTVATMPPPSVGGALIAVGLKCLEGLSAKHDFFSEPHLLQIAQIQRMLLELRKGDFDLQIADPEVMGGLLSEPSISQLRAQTVFGNATEISHPLGSTTQVSVIDADGAAVSLTLTNGEGCGYVLRGTGIEVNNSLGEADITPRGFHALQPGQAMMTMMAPTLAQSQSSRCIALGSGGSNRLRNAIMQTLSHIIEYGRSVENAVSAPRIHVESQGSGLELNIERDVLTEPHFDALRRHFPEIILFPERNMFFGGVHTAYVKGDHVGGIGDARRGGCVAFSQP